MGGGTAAASRGSSGNAGPGPRSESARPCRWSRDVEKFGARAFPGVGQKRMEQTWIAELEPKIGQQVLEIDLLRRALQHVEDERRAAGAARFGSLLYQQIEREVKAGSRDSPDVRADGREPRRIAPGRARSPRRARETARSGARRSSGVGPTYGSRRITAELRRAG
jgi:hypothetical protein